MVAMLKFWPYCQRYQCAQDGIIQIMALRMEQTPGAGFPKGRAHNGNMHVCTVCNKAIPFDPCCSKEFSMEQQFFPSHSQMCRKTNSCSTEFNPTGKFAHV